MSSGFFPNVRSVDGRQMRSAERVAMVYAESIGRYQFAGAELHPRNARSHDGRAAAR
jgi:hypothetical protein